MTAPVRRTSVPSAVGENRERIRILEAVPQRIAMRPPSMMGSCLSGGAIGVVGEYPSFRLRSGTTYRVDDDTDLEAGSVIEVDYLNHSGPRFGWMGVRLHLVTNLVLDDYLPRQPWESDPWAGGTGTYSPTGTFNRFTAFAAVTNDDGETVTWDNGVGAEQYSWDVTGVGHIGYAFHDFQASPFTGTITATFSGASTQRAGATQFCLGTGVTVGAMVGEDEFPSVLGANQTKQLTVTLTQDVPAGSVLMVIVATWDFDPTDASASGGLENVVDDNELRPTIVPGQGSVVTEVVTEMPHFLASGQWWPVSYPWEGRSDHQHNSNVYLNAGSSFTVYDSNGLPIFRVDEDGDLHGKTGKALTFDL